MAQIAPINPDLPPDQPLEPGSGPPRRTGARIATEPATPQPAKSSFIAAARRAAKALEDARQPKQAEPALPEGESSGGVMKRVNTVRAGKRPAISATTGSTRSIHGVGQGPSAEKIRCMSTHR